MGVTEGGGGKERFFLTFVCRRGGGDKELRVCALAVFRLPIAVHAFRASLHHSERAVQAKCTLVRWSFCEAAFSVYLRRFRFA
jgi:hypothetical protein